MTPLPEEIAAAERIADRYCDYREEFAWRLTRHAALTAFMEAREKAAEMMDEDYNAFAAMAFRNGEHLR